MRRMLSLRDNIQANWIEETCAPDLQEGQVRLAIKRFALTANNVTYAAAGDVLKYWSFYPAADPAHGIVPVWGFAVVEASRTDALKVGSRLYGFWPCADTAVITPNVIDGTVVDISPHRSKLPPIYNRYTFCPERSFVDEARQALLQPLLATSFLLADWLEDNAYFGAEQIIIGSASSKTGAGLGMFLREMQGAPKVVGLTSPANIDFVEAANACDEVLSYTQIHDIADIPSVYVDMSGNSAVKAQLHHLLGDNMKHSSAVGTSHWDKFAPSQDLPGAKPQFFFAPAQIEKRRADWAPGVIEKKIGQAWKSVAKHSDAWLDIVPLDGMDAAKTAFEDIAKGNVSARQGLVVNLG